MEETFHLHSLLLHLDPHVTTPPLVPASDIDPPTPTLRFSFMVLFYWTSRAWLIKGIQPITASRSHDFCDLLHLFFFFWSKTLVWVCNTASLQLHSQMSPSFMSSGGKIWGDRPIKPRWERAMNNALAGGNLTAACGFSLERPEDHQIEHLCLIGRTRASVYEDSNKGFIHVWRLLGSFSDFCEGPTSKFTSMRFLKRSV